MKRLHGFRDRQVGLAGTSRTNAEDNGVVINGLYVLALAYGLWAHALATTGDNIGGECLRDRLGGIDGNHVHGVLDRIWGQRMAPARDGFELIQGLFSARYFIIGTGYGHHIAAGKKVYIQQVVKHPQVVIRRSQHRAGISGVHVKLLGNDSHLVQSTSVLTIYLCEPRWQLMPPSLPMPCARLRGRV